MCFFKFANLNISKYQCVMVFLCSYLDWHVCCYVLAGELSHQPTHIKVLAKARYQ